MLKSLISFQLYNTINIYTMHFNISFKITPFLSLRVLELIHEAKWLTRLGIQIPDAAIAIMQQESRFKSYKSHLELVLNEYKEVCEAIPEPLQKLFTAHKDHVEQQLQPGLSTLAWNSMNIGMDLLINIIFRIMNYLWSFRLFAYSIQTSCS